MNRREMKQYFVVDLEVSVGIQAPVDPSTESMGALNSLLVTAYPASPSSGRTTTGPRFPGDTPAHPGGDGLRRFMATGFSRDHGPISFTSLPNGRPRTVANVFTQRSANRI